MSCMIMTFNVLTVRMQCQQEPYMVLDGFCKKRIMLHDIVRTRKPPRTCERLVRIREFESAKRRPKCFRFVRQEFFQPCSQSTIDIASRDIITAWNAQQYGLSAQNSQQQRMRERERVLVDRGGRSP